MSCASQPLISHFEVHWWETRKSHPSAGPELAGVSRGRLTPGRTHVGQGLLSSSQTGAVKISPHYLRWSHHRPVLAGEGKGREGLGVGDTTVCSVCLLRGGAVKIRKKYTFHHDTHSTPLALRLRPNSWGSLNRNETCYA